ncbi:PilC/PilY family type IV pilus protein [uncultured Xylophilus sp.]|uniref:pilus assembly protein n=1 Tax=uncultured Xylophilus sp. TaxID=296832 RepID=UPI0025FB7EA4|nr:PilC/PilY family type IV pilus protein [uncultured Xylophilus sp.]
MVCSKENAVRRRKAIKYLAIFTLPIAIVVSYLAHGAGTPPAIPSIDLSPEPLYAKGANDKPTLALALSVEFPTVGAQYVGEPRATEDATYSSANKYIGYFDTESCYSYVNDARVELRRFDRIGTANNRECGGTGFSGNFMNWATSSAVDVLRLGLTGGDRVVDTASMTILQRAVLPSGRFWNDANFPAKKLTAAAAAGAVPNALRRFTNGDAYTGDIYVANCLNRVHFGSAKAGDCTNPGNNSNLGISTVSGDPRNVSGFRDCANENGTCTNQTSDGAAGGSWLIVYGADNGNLRGWTYKVVDQANLPISCNNATFGDPVVGIGKKCYIRKDTTNWPRSTNSGLTADNFFYTRMQVCESDSAGNLQDPRTQYCIRYPFGNFKPVGNMQRFSDRIRVAAFGYLMDDQQSRYGGVLRAPMKYVGPKSFDSSGNLITSSNPNIEWNENTGIFIANPDNQSEGKSGVINYLNQFGRTGDAFGRYKTYDPVGELYYESLRYLQGLPPTPQALKDMTADMKQGFPVFPATSGGAWVDPHAGGDSSRNYACLKNNILVIGDVNTHNDKSIPGNTRLPDSEFARTADITRNEPDFVAWTNVVGGFEANAAVSYIDGTGAARTTSNPNGTTGERAIRTNLRNISTDNTGATLASYYMAGMAYWANTHDIRGADWNDAAKRRPGMRVSTYVLDVNEFAEDSIKDTRRNRQFFLAGKYGGFKDSSGRGNPFLNKDGALDNSSWEKSDAPGEAKNYFLSSNAEAVLKALDDIFVTIAAQGNTIAGSATSSTRVTAESTGLTYQARFDPADWSGDVQALPLNFNTTAGLSIGSATWSASSLLTAKAPSSRKIFVGRSTPSGSSTATAFEWTSIETSLKDALNKPNPGTSPDARGELRLNYLRGDRSQESAVFRKRGSVLGDIINSSISYSGEPSRFITDAGYKAFYDTNAARTKAVFVGANDGMLHAFDALNGNELFAYIPSWLGGKLSYLTNTNYNTSGHQSFVDGSSDVREAKVGSDWKTVLVGATGGGGQGVFALDVTNPSAFDATKVLWEFSDRDDPDIGNVVGRPQIVKMRTSAWTASTPVSKYFAVFGSGVNNYAADGNFSASGAPGLFFLDISKPAGTAWQLGVNYFKFLLPVNSTLAGSRATGLINFEAKGSPLGEAVQFYMGDLHGRLWKFDFGLAQGTSDWSTYRVSFFKGGSPIAAIPMFIAQDAAGVAQPITMAPSLASAPEGNTVVVFGTGKYLESSDNLVSDTTQKQSIYALWDNSSQSADSSPAGAAAISGRGRLTAATLTSGVLTTPAFTFGRPRTNSDSTQRSGWYFDFIQRGERQINPADLAGNTAAFSSVIPPDAASDACGQGSGGYYFVDIATGNGRYYASTVGVLGAPTFLDLGDAVIGPRDGTGRSVKTIKRAALVPGSQGTMVSDNVTDSYYVGRLSWRQINNYYELRKSATTQQTN